MAGVGDSEIRTGESKGSEMFTVGKGRLVCVDMVAEEVNGMIGGFI